LEGSAGHSLAQRSLFSRMKTKQVYMTIIYLSIKVLIDVVAHSEYGLLVECDITPGSVERSIDLKMKRVYLRGVIF
jgi:hypothetical protein